MSRFWATGDSSSSDDSEDDASDDDNGNNHNAALDQNDQWQFEDDDRSSDQEDDEGNRVIVKSGKEDQLQESFASTTTTTTTPHVVTKIGIVGFSRNAFDKETAYKKLRAIIETIITTANDRHQDDDDLSMFEIVSGAASGVPLLAYQIADELGITTVGISSNQARRVKSGLHPVKKVMLFGERFGDESPDFIAYIDQLIRIGGGSQSRHEVELFKQRNAGKDMSEILFEEEVDWYGR